MVVLRCFEKKKLGGGWWYCVCWPYLGLPCQMWFLWWGDHLLPLWFFYVSGHGSSGVLRFMRRWQILATWLLFLRAVHYWPTKDMCLQPSFVFPSPYISSYLSSFISFTLRFWYDYRPFFFLFLSSVCTLPYRPRGLPTLGPRSFPRVKRPGRDVNHPHHLAQRLKKEHSHTSKYIDIIISQNTTQFYAQYVQYISQLRVSAHFRPSSGCSL